MSSVEKGDWPPVRKPPGPPPRPRSFTSSVHFLGRDELWHLHICVDGREYIFIYKSHEEACLIEAKWRREFGGCEEIHPATTWASNEIDSLRAALRELLDSHDYELVEIHHSLMNRVQAARKAARAALGETAR